MANLNKNRFIKLFQHNLLVAIFVLTISCEQEELVFNPADLQFELPQFSLVDEALPLICLTESYNTVTWQISDGASYNSKSITHTFSKPGNYTIILTAFRNNKAIGSVSRTIEVFLNHRTFQANNGFFAKRCFYSQNKIILEGYQTDFENGELFYLVFDQQLNCIDTIATIDDFTKELSSVFEFENIAFGINSNDDGSTSMFKLKSSGLSEGISSIPLNTEIINYSKGYVHYYEKGSSDFLVNYYDDNLNKLWTKTFSSENAADKKYLFNINDKLFYISFDKNYDSLYIKKFKNISLDYNQSSISLGCNAESRQILFAFANIAQNAISLAVYSKEKDITSFYTIDENCNLINVKNISGYFNHTPVELQVDGSIITCSDNKLRKYTADWNLVAEKNMSDSKFGIGKIGCNLYLIFENLPEGLRLSYVDKHLANVNFE